MTDLALITLSPQGLVSARVLREALGEGSLHAHRGVPAADAEPFDRMADLLAQLWPVRRRMVLFAPAGAVARALAARMESKHTDPAVVVADVHGRWAIALLSGHEGGANALAHAVANALGGEPVVTTTTEAVKDLIAGVGCRRGAAPEPIVAAVREALERSGMVLERVRLLASAGLKAAEPGLLEAARRLGLPLRFIPAADIRTSPFRFSPSAAAVRQLDLPGVAEPAALLAGSRTRLVLPRTVIQGVTVALAQELWAGSTAPRESLP
ncbi:MAG: cobalamin biosynthesis protein [Holophaga sp.]|nr:cobalamin biosynthesis protein [Holophaga sp.]